MKKRALYFLSIAVVLGVMSPQLTSAKIGSIIPLEDNVDKKAKKINDFYNALDRDEYTEFPNAKINIREVCLYKNIDKVLAKTNRYGRFEISGHDPDRQVYVFCTVSLQYGKTFKKVAIFDAESGKTLGKGDGTSNQTFAGPSNTQKPNVLEEIAQSKSPIGDNTVPIKEAVAEFEKKNQKIIFLPKHIPFESTHTGAIYDDASEMITLIYYNQHTYDHMKVDIYPQRKIPRRKINSRHNEVSLADGTKALYVHEDRQVADFIIFTKEGLEYRIGISKRMHEVKFETLSKVAESIIS